MNIVLKIRIFLLTILSLICVANISKSQILNYSNYKPISFTYNSFEFPLTPFENVVNLEMPSFNKDSLLEEDIINDSLGFPFRYGYDYKVNYNLNNIGTWDTLENGDRLWRLKIICSGAYSINLVYNNFYLPENSMFFIYNEEQNYVLGPYTERINRNYDEYATGLIPGSTTILEYFEPFQKRGLGTIELSNIIYAYKNIVEFYLNNNSPIGLKSPQLLSSGSCNRDVKCSEGADWCREIFSVSRVLVGNGHLCSGSLINNAREDFTPYYLTANHCNSGNPNTWVFEFGYRRSGCGSGGLYQTVQYTGADLISHWSLSDFALLRLLEPPESGDYIVTYFNGWDRSNDMPNSTTCIHHPSGDVMKISHDYESPVICDYLSTTGTSHWKVIWNVGTTEPGSSGAPLFNTLKNVIGQLHGGYASCSNQNGPDYYGRFNISWEGGGTPQTRLKDWLDPENTGIEVLNGIALPYLHYGRNINNGDVRNLTAYDILKIGSNTYAPYTVHPGGNLSLKDGREIVIRPCTKIVEGSTFRAYIDDISCNDMIYFQYQSAESEYGGNVCGSYPPRIGVEDSEPLQTFENVNLSIIPNPFSSSTTITITLPEADNVNLAVFDMLGRKIYEFANGAYFSTGEHRFTLESQNLESGMFYVNFATKNNYISKSLILVK